MTLREIQHIERRLETARRGPQSHRAVLLVNSELEDLYQEIIPDHSRRPRNFGELADAAVVVHGDNPACGDEIHLT